MRWLLILLGCVVAAVPLSIHVAGAAGQQRAYVPFVIKDSRAACPTSSQLILNPGFEDAFPGNATGWSTAGLGPGAARTSSRARNGAYSWQGPSAGQQSLYQYFEVPQWAERGALYFSWYMESAEPSSEFHDQLWVLLPDGPSGGGYSRTITNTAARDTWTDERVELSSIQALRGVNESIQLKFTEDADGKPTTFWVDDVRLVVTCGNLTP